MIVLGVIFLLFSLINPRSLWYTFSAWQYRHPAANEPSDERYAWGRVSCVITGLVLVVIGLNMNADLTGSVFGVRDHRAAAERVASAVQSRSPFEVPQSFDEGEEIRSAVEGALRTGRPQSTLELVSSGETDGARHYTLAGSPDDAFCLTVTETSRSEWRMSVGGWPAKTVGTEIGVRTDLTDGACAVGSR